MTTFDFRTSNPPKEFAFSIPNGGSQEFFYNYNFVAILALSTPTGVTLRFGASGNATSVVGAGLKYRFDVILDRLTVTNNTGGTLTGTIGIGIGDIDDNRLNVSGTVTTQDTRSATIVDAADVTITATTTASIIAANSARRRVIIANNIANGTVIRVGTSSAGAARGVEIPVGGSISLETTAEIFAYNPSASSIVISYLEEHD